ncbi:MAG: HEAT repeat domain-containing protein [Acidobacteria bacterium]|nr:HEAT repeat domain-containing protein [Acidobacteriota bacterium]
MLSLSIERLVAQFETNPVLARRSCQDAWASSPEKFFAKAVEVLCKQGLGTGQRFLISFLTQNAGLEDKLGNPELMTREESVTLARLAMRVDPSLDIKLANRVASASGEEPALALRLLEVLEAVAEVSSLLPILGHVLRHPDERVRSKAALLMGKGNQNPRWVTQQLFDPDARVRANAVESLWGATSREAVEVFRLAVQDAHPRTVINAALGLYLSGQKECIESFLELSRHPDPAFRLSTSWGLGRTGDPRFLRVLTELARDAESKVRAAALRSTVRIRNYRSILESAGSYQIQVLGGQITSSGMRSLDISLKQSGIREPPTLAPLSFALEEDNVPVARYEADAVRAPKRHFGIILPAAADVARETAAALDTMLRSVAQTKSSGDHWAVVSHTHCDVATPPSATVSVRGYHAAPAAISEALAAAGSAPAAGFLPAVLAFLAVPSNVKRAQSLILFASPLPENTSIVLLRQHQMQSVTSRLNDAGISVQAIVPQQCPPLLRTALRDLCAATGGVLHPAESESTAVSVLESLLSTPVPSHHIRYWGFSKQTLHGQVRIMVHSPTGIGEAVYAIAAPDTQPSNLTVDAGLQPASQSAA